MSALEELSESLGALVEANAPSVVRVEARRGAASSGVVFGEGLVFTAEHSVEEEAARVFAGDEGERAAKVVGVDASTDLALLRVDGHGLRPPAWSPIGGLKVGHLAVAVARPGRTARAALGMVSALSPGPWRAPGGGRLERFLQIDHALHPGFSGSLLVDTSGKALGMNTAGILRGAGLAVPFATLQRVAGALLSRGAVQRAFLGIGSYPVRLPAALAQEAGQESALLAVSVQPGGPADSAGILLGDVLLALRGQKVRSLEDLYELLEEELVGKEVEAKVARAGQVRQVRIALGARGAA